MFWWMKAGILLLSEIFLLHQLPWLVESHEDESAGDRLHDEILGNYNKFILPVEGPGECVDIRILLKLVQLSDIDERNQMMTTNVWLRHEWHDANLIWDPREYDNITKIQLPCDDVWLPDTILYNNADGDYQITIQTKVAVHYDGHMIWRAPAIYTSFCDIDVEFFPYDEQVCELKFGPWTYDVSKVDYWLYDPKDDRTHNITSFLHQAADLEDYSDSVEWDILQISGQKTIWHYPCCTEEYVDITYKVHLRRKTLYYTINLIIPVVLISLLTVFVFYTPSESYEKVTLSISIHVSLTMFLLVLLEIIPPTSKALPLICKYILFTMLLVTLSIGVTVVIISIHHRHPYNYEMPNWVRKLFLVSLPGLLFGESERCSVSACQVGIFSKGKEKSALPKGRGSYENFPEPRQNNENVYSPFRLQKSMCRLDLIDQPCFYENFAFYENMAECNVDNNKNNKSNCERVIEQVLGDVSVISTTFRDWEEEEEKETEWQMVARVIDRLCLLVFTSVVLIGTCAILASAPALYDTTPPAK